MSYYGNQDFMLEVAAGNITGKSSVNKFGNNTTLGSGATETVWDGSNSYTFPTTADITHISQDVDQVAMRGGTIEVQGLDTNYALVTQNVDLDATLTTTAVALGTALRRVFRAKVLENVVTTSDIDVHNVGDTTDHAVIMTGNNQTLMAVYTVPASKTAYMTNYYAVCNKVSGGGSPELLVKLWARDNANVYAKQIKHVVGTDSDATSRAGHVFAPYFKATEKTDIWIDATEITGGGGVIANVTAGFDLILVDN